MEKKTLSIPNISCGHCVMSIKNELGEMEGVTKVEGDPQKKEILGAKASTSRPAAMPARTYSMPSARV